MKSSIFTAQNTFQLTLYFTEKYTAYTNYVFVLSIFLYPSTSEASGKIPNVHCDTKDDKCIISQCQAFCMIILVF